MTTSNTSYVVRFTDQLLQTFFAADMHVHGSIAEQMQESDRLNGEKTARTLCLIFAVAPSQQKVLETRHSSGESETCGDPCVRDGKGVPQPSIVFHANRNGGEKVKEEDYCEFIVSSVEIPLD
jgi:hypothetical protein